MEVLGQAAAVIGVLVLLAAVLHWLRKGGMPVWPVTGRGERRMQVLERLVLSPQHCLHLVRVGERTLLVATSPAGCTVLESAPALEEKR